MITWARYPYDGTVVVVTGAGLGIGAAIARAFLENAGSRPPRSPGTWVCFGPPSTGASKSSRPQLSEPAQLQGCCWFLAQGSVAEHRCEVDHTIALLDLSSSK